MRELPLLDLPRTNFPGNALELLKDQKYSAVALMRVSLRVESGSEF